MSLTLIKEDGTGNADANSYADVADANAYYAAHLYATAWTAATDDQKAVALVMATRLIDAEFQFNGTRTTAGQACNGRGRCAPSRTTSMCPISVLLPIPYDYVEYDKVPKAVIQATCEMARELLIADRTVVPAGEGLSITMLPAFNPVTTKLTGARAFTSRASDAGEYGSQISAKSGTVRLVRV